jgi:DtxR family Mn-dependent transcriptional regulator
MVAAMGHNGAVSGDLIDTTEMYLRTVFELEEEGVTPLRARIAERLHQSGPTVSQTVARMERDGLLTVEGDRHLELTDEGRQAATRVMRKHRLVERLLTDVIGLDIELVHEEACRWEHVVSEHVERRLVELLHHPTESPYGNPIPGLQELGEVVALPLQADGARPLSEVVSEHAVRGEEFQVLVHRIAEPLQNDVSVLTDLRRVGALPGHHVQVCAATSGAQLRGAEGPPTLLDSRLAAHVLVSRS